MIKKLQLCLNLSMIEASTGKPVMSFLINLCFALLICLFLSILVLLSTTSSRTTFIHIRLLHQKHTVLFRFRFISRV